MTSFSDADNATTNLIINYLPQTLTDKELFSMFVTIGPVESCRVMKDNKTGYSYGFGFVNYTREEDAAKAISQLNGLPVQNKKLKVSYARPAGDEIKETNLYVTNLPRNVTEEQLENIFSPYGNIVQKNILKDKITGSPRGVAFVRYDKKEEAQSAIDSLNGTMVPGSTDPIQVKIAEEHGKQKAAYFAGWQAGYSQTGGGPPSMMKKPNYMGNQRGGGGAGGYGGMSGGGAGGYGGMPGGGAGGYGGISGGGAGYGGISRGGGQNFRGRGGGFQRGGGAMKQNKFNNRFNPVGGGGYNPAFY